jgi:hypothetical protein
MFDLARILGHSTTRTTELYAHMMPDHMHAQRNVVNIAAPLQTMAAHHGGNPRVA